jgi:hypothetical protein
VDILSKERRENEGSNYILRRGLNPYPRVPVLLFIFVSASSFISFLLFEPLALDENTQDHDGGPDSIAFDASRMDELLCLISINRIVCLDLPP